VRNAELRIKAIKLQFSLNEFHSELRIPNSEFHYATRSLQT